MEPNKIRSVRIDDATWAILVGMAARLVHDSELPSGTNPANARVGTMLRLIADGTIVAYRPVKEA